MTDTTSVSQEGLLTPSTTFDLKYLAILPHTPYGGTATPFDITNQFQEFSIFQDLGVGTTAGPAINGTILMADGWDMLDTMPILGGEEIVISWRSTAATEYTTLSMRVERIGEVAESTDSSAKKVFMIYMVTTDTYRDSMTRRSLGFAGTYSEIAAQLYENLQSGKVFDVDDSTGILDRFATPLWPVLKSLDWMARRAYDDLHMPFVFYEDFNGYHFKCLTTLFNMGKETLTEAEKDAATPRLWRDPHDAPYLQNGIFNSERFLRNIIQIEKKVNRDQVHGNYRDIYGFKEQLYDFESKTMIVGNRSYLGWFPKVPHLDQYPLFVDDYERENTHFVETTPDGSEAIEYPRRVIEYMLASTMARVLLVGDNRLQVGQVFHIDDISNRPKQNEELAELSKLTSGRYIITKLRHKVSKRTGAYNCIAEIAKDSLHTEVLPPVTVNDSAPKAVDEPTTDISQAQQSY